MSDEKFNNIVTHFFSNMVLFYNFPLCNCDTLRYCLTSLKLSCLQRLEVNN